MVTLEGFPFNSSMISFHIWLHSKNQYIHCKTMFTCWVSLFCNGFTHRPMAKATLVDSTIEIQVDAPYLVLIVWTQLDLFCGQNSELHLEKGQPLL
jgi:hypothetical protein